MRSFLVSWFSRVSSTHRFISNNCTQWFNPHFDKAWSYFKHLVELLSRTFLKLPLGVTRWQMPKNKKMKKNNLYGFCWSWLISIFGSLKLGPYGPKLTDSGTDIGPGRVHRLPCSSSTVWVMIFFLSGSLLLLTSIPDWSIDFFQILQQSTW